MAPSLLTALAEITVEAHFNHQKAPYNRPHLVAPFPGKNLKAEAAVKYMSPVGFSAGKKKMQVFNRPRDRKNSSYCFKGMRSEFYFKYGI